MSRRTACTRLQECLLRSVVVPIWDWHVNNRRWYAQREPGFIRVLHAVAHLYYPKAQVWLSEDHSNYVQTKMTTHATLDAGADLCTLSLFNPLSCPALSAVNQETPDLKESLFTIYYQLGTDVDHTYMCHYPYAADTSPTKTAAFVEFPPCGFVAHAKSKVAACAAALARGVTIKSDDDDDDDDDDEEEEDDEEDETALSRYCFESSATKDRLLLPACPRPPIDVTPHGKLTAMQQARVHLTFYVPYLSNRHVDAQRWAATLAQKQLSYTSAEQEEKKHADVTVTTSSTS